jgi:hypothetical protein
MPSSRRSMPHSGETCGYLPAAARGDMCWPIFSNELLVIEQRQHRRRVEMLASREGRGRGWPIVGATTNASPITSPSANLCKPKRTVCGSTGARGKASSQRISESQLSDCHLATPRCVPSLRPFVASLRCVPWFQAIVSVQTSFVGLCGTIFHFWCPVPLRRPYSKEASGVQK